jgi:type IV pilus assembly protein PilB
LGTSDILEENSFMATAAPVQQKRELGHLLTQQGLLTSGQLTIALRKQRETGQPLGQVLIDLKLVAEEDVTRARALQVDLPYVRIEDLTIDKAALSLVEAAVARKHLFLPVGTTPDGTLKVIVAAWNAHIMEAAGKAGARHRLRIAPALATEAHVRAAIDLYYGQMTIANVQSEGTAERPAAGRSATPALVTEKPDGLPGGPAAEKRASDLFASHLPATVRSSPNRPDEIDEVTIDQPVIIQFVNRILSDAINRGASDIHFEPRRDALDIRYRIDGTLVQIDSVRREFQAACASRIKIMSEMNIAERRLPQDGRIAVTTEGRSVDMRVSSLPTQFGESVVLRILDKSGVRPSLDQLGFSERNLHTLNGLIRKPHGIFLATGPTGSGKTTTLYSAIQAIHTPDVNIITVEDPIEYELDGIRQSNVNEKAGLTFARQLRAILRQDPDIIYVGEIRDAETAEIAFRAALTGHLVFSTLHCNDAAGAITRLLNMNVDPFLVASTVVGVLAQRLVRKVCPKCAEASPPSDTDLAAFGLGPESPGFSHASFVHGAGCAFCAQTGYKGRYSVQELMVMDDAIRAMTLQRVPSTKIRRAAIARGMVSMRQDAASKIMRGITTFEEAQKRVYLEEEAPETAQVF